MSTISIVITAFRRHMLLEQTLRSIRMQTRQPDQIVVIEDGADEGHTERVCKQAGLPVEWYARANRPALSYSNPAAPKNMGIKKATGDILIIQCGEVKYETPNDIANLAAPVETHPNVSMIATCKALNPDGSFEKWYAGPERSVTWFLDFCQAVRRDKVLAIGGFDQNFKAYGFDDDDFSYRLQKSGVEYRWAENVVTSHQWHPPADGGGTFSHYLSELSENDRKYLALSKAQIESGDRSVVANEGVDWGSLLS